ncbi:MAG: NnrU family protein [Pseudomonadota bacterium]|nr:NnrU family protein [Pseudomonadota bacterium]
MALIILGIILWSVVHLIPAVTPGIKARWQGALGKNGYRASFSLLILAALLMMVMGWRHSLPIYLYTLSEQIHLATIGIMTFAVVLFVAAKLPSRLKRIIRHPQLTGVALWALAHLLANGDSRSVALFGGVLTWAVIEIIVINRREGQWQKPPAKGLYIEVLLLGISAAVFVGLIMAHPYLSGIKLG